MKSLRKLYHFLGGVHFAIFLIAATALFVISGTFIESASQSHRYASLFTYDNMIFSALLWGFFVNILFAATRRWPFKYKHIPFLITHLGLLMILSGVITKRQYGLQGTMSLIEGSGTDKVMIADSYAISLRSKSDQTQTLFPLKQSWNGEFSKFLGKVNGNASVWLVDYTPHAKSHLATWVKGSNAFIAGLSPMQMDNHTAGTIPEPRGKVRFHQSDTPVWDLYALKTTAIADAIEALTSKSIKKPLVAILENHSGDVTLAAIDPNGSQWSSTYKQDGLDQIIAYDDGFGGYSVRAELPFTARSITLEERLAVIASLIEKQLREADEVNIPLSPPLQLLKEGCHLSKTDFSAMASYFLAEWNRSGRWLYDGSIPLPESLKGTFSMLPWNTISPEEYAGCQLAVRLNEHIGEDIASGEDPLSVLRKNKWPLSDALEKQMHEENSPSLLTLLTRQLFVAAQLAPTTQMTGSSSETNAALLSAYFSAYGITLNEIAPDSGSDEITALVMDNRQKNSGDLPANEKITIETPIAQMFTPLEPGKKLEDNTPMVTLQLNTGKRAQMIRLGYDRSGEGLMWPALEGDYLVRFQNDQRTLPYRVRLRQARQINYANSTQPYSYESDLIITDKRDGRELEKTISMNKVHETPEGYRFYLSSISSPQADSIKRVTIVVNYDPTKYWLTYPGALILTLGIILLFTLRPYRSKA